MRISCFSFKKVDSSWVRSQRYNELKFKWSEFQWNSPVEASFASNVLPNTLDHKHTNNKNLIKKPKYVFLLCISVYKGLWITAKLDVTVIRVLLRVKFSRLKSQVNWRLTANCTRFIAIRTSNFFPPLIHRQQCLWVDANPWYNSSWP